MHVGLPALRVVCAPGKVSIRPQDVEESASSGCRSPSKRLCCLLPQISPSKPAETKAEKKRREKIEEARRAAADYKARQRMLGNIQFIGQLYIKKMLTERIMHECIVKLLGEVGRIFLVPPPCFSRGLGCEADGCSRALPAHSPSCTWSYRWHPMHRAGAGLSSCCIHCLTYMWTCLLQVSNPRQEDVESLVKLVRTIGATLEESGVRTFPCFLLLSNVAHSPYSSCCNNAGGSPAHTGAASATCGVLCLQGRVCQQCLMYRAVPDASFFVTADQGGEEPHGHLLRPHPGAVAVREAGVARPLCAPGLYFIRACLPVQLAASGACCGSYLPDSSCASSMVHGCIFSLGPPPC